MVIRDHASLLSLTPFSASRRQVAALQSQTRDIVAMQASITMDDAGKMISAGKYTEAHKQESPKGWASNLAMAPALSSADHVDVEGIELGRVVPEPSTPSVTWVVILGEVDSSYDQEYPDELQAELEEKYQRFTSNKGGYFTSRQTAVKFDSKALGMNDKNTYKIDWENMEQVR